MTAIEVVCMVTAIIAVNGLCLFYILDHLAKLQLRTKHEMSISAPTTVAFDDAFLAKMQDMVNSKDKCKALRIFEPVDCLPYFYVLQITPQLSKNTRLQQVSPFVAFMGRDTMRIYFFPLDKILNN